MPITSGSFRSAVATDGAEAEALLTARERRLCQDLPARRRSDFRAGRLALKRAASCLGRTDEAELSVGSAQGGPPSVALRQAKGPRRTGLSVSLAHCDGRAVAAACWAPARIGVDVERHKRIDDSKVRLFLGPDERAEVRAEVPELDATTLWTLKEASWKAMMIPRSIPFHALELIFCDGALAELRYGGRRWLARSLSDRPWLGYVVSVVLAYPPVLP